MKLPIFGNCCTSYRVILGKYKNLQAFANTLQSQIAELQDRIINKDRELSRAKEKIAFAETQLESCKRFAEYYKNELGKAQEIMLTLHESNETLREKITLHENRVGRLIAQVGGEYNYAEQVKTATEQAHPDITTAPDEVKAGYYKALGKIETLAPVLAILNTETQTPDDPKDLRVDIALG